MFWVRDNSSSLIYKTEKSDGFWSNDDTGISKLEKGDQGLGNYGN